MGVLPYIDVSDELSLLTQSHQKRESEKQNFKKKQQILHQHTIEIKQVEQIAKPKYNYSSSEVVEFHPLLLASSDHSTLQP